MNVQVRERDKKREIEVERERVRESARESNILISYYVVATIVWDVANKFAKQLF